MVPGQPWQHDATRPALQPKLTACQLGRVDAVQVEMQCGNALEIQSHRQWTARHLGGFTGGGASC